MLTFYIASALFGGCVLVGSWLLGHDHAPDAPDVPDGADPDGASHEGHAVGPLASLLKLRFWTFGLTFFGLAGLLLQLLAGPTLGGAVPLLAVLAGASAGFVATRVLGRLLASSPGAVQEARAHVGREGTLLLPIERGQRGKVRLELPSGAALDLLAEAQGEEDLPMGTRVMVLELRASVALVARSLTEKGKP